jgi:methylmalonyl-CoA mutase C-terminal domain/subunit
MASNILPYKGIWPVIDVGVFLAPNAYVIGDVEIGPETNIWFGCVVRGDMNVIRIGRRVNVQDATVIHVDSRKYGTFIGDDVTIGHSAIIHACTLADRSFIGMQACIMDGAVVESDRPRAAGILEDGTALPRGRHRLRRRLPAARQCGCHRGGRPGEKGGGRSERQRGKDGGEAMSKAKAKARKKKQSAAPVIRVLLAKVGLDGHDRGVKVVARCLRDAGMDVVYSGLHRTPAEVVEAAVQEDVDVLGVSLLSGAHMTIIPEILRLLEKQKADDIAVVAGGVIPDDDVRELKKRGVAEVLLQDSTPDAIVSTLRRVVAARGPR